MKRGASRMLRRGLVLVIAIVIIIILAINFPFTGNHINPPGQYDEFAQCLSGKGLVLYGTYRCGHCNIQKQMFGDSFQYVNYIECDPTGENGNPELCLAAGISAYPTWILNGEHYIGRRSFETLAEISGCELPSS